jgi:hypothetical protein
MNLTALNVKLKADKEISFGDVEAGAEVGNADNGFISLMPPCFTMSKTNLSLLEI